MSGLDHLVRWWNVARHLARDITGVLVTTAGTATVMYGRRVSMLHHLARAHAGMTAAGSTDRAAIIGVMVTGASPGLLNMEP
jgi:hypothetical protein